MLERDGSKIRIPKDKLADAAKDGTGKTFLENFYEKL